MVSTRATKKRIPVLLALGYPGSNWDRVVSNRLIEDLVVNRQLYAYVPTGMGIEERVDQFGNLEATGREILPVFGSRPLQQPDEDPSMLYEPGAYIPEGITTREVSGMAIEGSDPEVVEAVAAEYIDWLNTRGYYTLQTVTERDPGRNGLYVCHVTPTGFKEPRLEEEIAVVEAVTYYDIVIVEEYVEPTFIVIGGAYWLGSIN